MTYFGVAASGSLLHATNDEGIWGFLGLAGDITGLRHATVTTAIRGTTVNATPPTDQQVLVYDSVASEWQASGVPPAPSAAHDLLSSTHGDTVASAVTRGSIIRGNTTPAWEELALGTAEFVLFSDGSDVLYTRLGAPTPFSLGAQGTPSMTFTGDLDTGLSAAAADIMIASAGGSAIATFDGINTKLILTGGQVVGNTTEGAGTTLDSTDYTTFVSAAPVTITLPAAPTAGEVHVIKDSAGNATGSTRITIDGNGNNIDGNSTIEIRNAYGSFTLVYNGTIWNVI